MQQIWLNSGVQNCYDRRNEYGLGDSAGYFMESLDRYSQSDFIPTVQDVLHTRFETKGIVEFRFNFKVST